MEGKTFKGRAPQEGKMDTASEKILMALDEHGEAPKRIGGCLIRLEESKLKKSPHVEIQDDEKEEEEWDEKDKVE